MARAGKFGRCGDEHCRLFVVAKTGEGSFGAFREARTRDPI